MKKEISKKFAECLRYICNCNCYKDSVGIYNERPCLAIFTTENPMFVFTRFLESCDYGKWLGYDEDVLMKEVDEIWKKCEIFRIKDNSKETVLADGRKIIVVKGNFIIVFTEYALPAIQ